MTPTQTTTKSPTQTPATAATAGTAGTKLVVPSMFEVDRLLTQNLWEQLPHGLFADLNSWVRDEIGLTSDEWAPNDATVAIRFLQQDLDGQRLILVRNYIALPSGAPATDASGSAVVFDSLYPVAGAFPEFLNQLGTWTERARVILLEEIILPADTRRLIALPGMTEAGSPVRWDTDEPIDYYSSDPSVAVASSEHPDGTYAMLAINRPGHAFITAVGTDILGRKQVCVGHIRVGEPEEGDNCVIGSMDFQSEEQYAVAEGEKILNKRAAEAAAKHASSNAKDQERVAR